MKHEATQSAAEADRQTPLSYEPSRRQYRPLIREGIGSIIGAVFALSIGASFMVGSIGTLALASSWQHAGMRVTGLCFVVIGLIGFGFAAVYIVDAVVELGGREPPTWRWYRFLGRNRRR